MRSTRSRAGFKSLNDRLYEARARWHRKQKKMSFARKLEALDRLRLRAKELKD